LGRVSSSASSIASMMCLRTIVRKHIIEAMEDAEEETRPKRKGLRPLGDGEAPPYDLEAT